MPASIQLRSLSWTTPDGTPLFDRLDLRFGPERTGLVGRNGSGKSTLLRLVAGDLTPSFGTVLIEGEARLLRQSAVPRAGETIADAFGVADALACLERLEGGIGTGEDVAEADWSLPGRLSEALAEAGLRGVAPSHRLAALSGGQRTRAALAALAFGPPAILLLDEPTNNLDAEGRAAVARLLERHRGGAIVASHDRDLLRRMDRIVELSSLGARLYGGNWDAYAAQRAEERAAAADDLDRAGRRLRHVEREGQEARERQERHAHAGKLLRLKGGTPRILLGGMKNRAEGTTGRVQRLADKQQAVAESALEAARAAIERLEAMKVTLASPMLPSGKTVLALDRVSGGPDPAAPVIRDLSFEIVGPERVAIDGPNGAGKTSLLRLATGALKPVSGRVALNVSAAMLDQDVKLLDPGATIRDNFRRLNPADSENACRAALARFLFRADAALKRVDTLSGGEKLRAGLACVLGGSAVPGLVILDEPTNHLDLDSIAAIEAGLNAYDGALLVVSHDADFLAAIGVTRRIAL